MGFMDRDHLCLCFVRTVCDKLTLVLCNVIQPISVKVESSRLRLVTKSTRF